MAAALAGSIAKAPAFQYNKHNIINPVKRRPPVNSNLNATLAAAAIEARRAAYAPYSHFAVGAALLAEDGRIFTGCNVENASSGVTNCAERTALFKAISEGARQFTAIAIAGAPADNDGSQGLPPCPPCGVCRQALNEFCPDSMPVLLALGQGHTTAYTLGQLLPHSFGPQQLA